MKIIEKLNKYIEDKEINYSFIAEEIGLEEKELKRKLLWEKDMLITELEEIFAVLNISYEDLIISEDGGIIKQITLESGVEEILDSLSYEDREFVQELMRLVESNMDNKLKPRKMYMN